MNESGGHLRQASVWSFLGVGLDAHVKGDAVCQRMAMQRQADRSM
ncbi:Uncharacterised protein [Mycobacteroides abscessus subsp. abscessus]|nr:Uncharacterised protein [Mycobacteroides abscessus subsp. abscessus]SIG20112.1 Uncharacterised protein [Mycobacteroides abscessus subsp. abscessus]SIN51603.1 Uncharacterised protein [Mycobacteroides abscessus subsp. abscessus]SKU24112.1 Uncharacterised protein [Mycobacteroides abscessus subsp. abscessus]SKU31522.1 Uncharacterised protein [Mycobacteroides abscessus subsp. abscessus]